MEPTEPLPIQAREQQLIQSVEGLPDDAKGNFFQELQFAWKVADQRCSQAGTLLWGTESRSVQSDLLDAKSKYDGLRRALSQSPLYTQYRGWAARLTDTTVATDWVGWFGGTVQTQDDIKQVAGAIRTLFTENIRTDGLISPGKDVIDRNKQVAQSTLDGFSITGALVTDDYDSTLANCEAFLKKTTENPTTP